MARSGPRPSSSTVVPSEKLRMGRSSSRSALISRLASPVVAFRRAAFKLDDPAFRVRMFMVGCMWAYGCIVEL